MVTPLSGSDKPREFPAKFNALLDDVDTKATQQALDNATSGLASETYVDSVASDLIARRRTGLRFHGVEGSYAACAGNLPLASGDLTVQVHYRVNAKAAGHGQTFAAQWGSGGAAFRFGLTSNGGVEIIVSNNGSSSTAGGNFSASVNQIPDGVEGWMRFVYTASLGRIWLFDSLDGETFTSRSNVNYTPGAIHVSSLPVSIGDRADSTPAAPFDGTIFDVQLRDGGSTGPLVASPLFDLPTHPRMTDAQGNIWSYQGDAYSWELPA